MEVIFQGERERQETLTYMHDKSKTHILNGLKIDIPENIILCILSYLQREVAAGERKRLIEQAEREFNEK